MNSIEGDNAPPPSTPRKSRMRRLFLELGVAGLGYAILTRCQTSDLLDNGEVAPEFATTDLDGTRVSLQDYTGRPLLLHFWATWCGICRQEFGALSALHRELQHTPDANSETLSPRLITLAADEDPRVVQSFVREHQLAYPVLLAPPALLRAYKVHAFPTSYYLDADKRIRSGTIGMSSRWAMKTRLSCASR